MTEKTLNWHIICKGSSLFYIPVTFFRRLYWHTRRWSPALPRSSRCRIPLPSFRTLPQTNRSSGSALADNAFKVLAAIPTRWKTFPSSPISGQSGFICLLSLLIMIPPWFYFKLCQSLLTDWCFRTLSPVCLCWRHPCRLLGKLRQHRVVGKPKSAHDQPLIIRDCSQALCASCINSTAKILLPNGSNPLKIFLSKPYVIKRRPWTISREREIFHRR